ncbi:hypothetical protein EDB19DRAFT_680027 [Suillus lakei]|nr:hypothetical protein EDB19DRAFT_680027 [Suillus lakei]
MLITIFGLLFYFPLSLDGAYIAINQNLADTEKLLNLLAEPTEVIDAPGTRELVVSNSEVEFENYDNQTHALHNISFKVPLQQTCSPRRRVRRRQSNTLRLLYLFHDLQQGEGCILTDGKDIRTVTLSSLHHTIGQSQHAASHPQPSHPLSSRTHRGNS